MWYKRKFLGYKGGAGYPQKFGYSKTFGEYNLRTHTIFWVCRQNNLVAEKIFFNWL